MGKFGYRLCISIALTVIVFYTPSPAQARSPSCPEQPHGIRSTVSVFSYTVGKHPVLMYILNRKFDLFDILRLRVRIGPGLSIGARVTEVLDLFMGSHATGYVG
ncbi:MAG: hypothetical protein N3B18_09455, partial [Desulfobacterota bacterium]|nr:hypothetical protein [Thermodesulfobacteriota bacterium]